MALKFLVFYFKRFFSLNFLETFIKSRLHLMKGFFVVVLTTLLLTSQLNRKLLGVTLGQGICESHPKGSDALMTI